MALDRRSKCASCVDGFVPGRAGLVVNGRLDMEEWYNTCVQAVCSIVLPQGGSMVPTFWKLSHGQEYFTYKQLLDAMNARLVYVHKDTAGIGGSLVSQATSFVEATIGDYFFLTHGNQGCTCLANLLGRRTCFLSAKEDGLIGPIALLDPPLRQTLMMALRRGGPLATIQHSRESQNLNCQNLRNSYWGRSLVSAWLTTE